MLGQRLEIRQGQGLVITPQLQQAIKLLQMSNLELVDYIEQELEQNPLLERPEGESRDGGADDGGGEDRAAGESHDAELDSDGFSDGGYEVESADAGETELSGYETPEGGDLDSTKGAIDADYENIYGEDSPSERAESAPESADASLGPDLGLSNWSQTGSGGGGFDDGEFSLERTLADTVGLKEHLLEQVNVALNDPQARMIGAILVECVDEAGYLGEPLDSIIERYGCDRELTERVLAVCQRFDPPGVFARDLAECLGLQLIEKDRFDPAMQTFVANLDLLAKHDLDGLRKVCGVDMEDLRDMITELRALTPKPGQAFSDDVAQPVIPDVFVREKADGGWQVELNTETLPRVLVNNRYYAEVSERTRKKTDRNYLMECMQNANWLVKALDQRARTILKVSSEIVRQQDAFLAHGVQHLRPLNLRTVAEAIDMHESTVSRVTSNKYMATPRGIFELKYFFTAALGSTEGGDAHSAEAVRFRIKELVDREPATAILSDDALADILRADGIDIARRTVAKYREAMGIPSSVQRRRMKRLSA